MVRVWQMWKLCHSRGESEKGCDRVEKQRPFGGDRLLTAGEVAAILRISNMTVYRLIKSGQLAAVRVGKNYRIRESDVDGYLSERTVKAEGPKAEGK